MGAGLPMQTPHEVITARLEGSVFALAFETEQIIGFRSGLKGEVVRALHINLERHTVEYELLKGGLLIRRQAEYFPTLAHLIEKLPVTVDSFDMKFQGLRLKEDGGLDSQPRRRAPLAANEDPWDLTNYFDNPHTGKPHVEPRLKPLDKKPK
jgi:hypothetical protein